MSGKKNKWERVSCVDSVIVLITRCSHTGGQREGKWFNRYTSREGDRPRMKADKEGNEEDEEERRT